MSELDLATWSREQSADGRITLTAPAPHPAFAARRRARLRIRYDAPLATLDEVCAELPIVRADPVERIATHGGEHGAYRRHDVTVGDEVLTWAVGVIAVDDRMIVLDGLARSPNIAALVRDLLEQVVWAGAPERIRMVPYRAPAGWFGVRRTMATCWLAPEAPAAIVVCDAVPRGPAERTLALAWPLEAPAHAARDEHVASWTDGGRLWAVAQHADARWIVHAALQAGEPRHLEVLRDLVRSIELPAPPRSSQVTRDLDPYGWMAL